MRRFLSFAMCMGLVTATGAADVYSAAKDGMELEQLRDSVLRLHVLANSDSAFDQRLKLCVRDKLLEHSQEIFGDCENAAEAEKTAEKNTDKIREMAEQTLAEHGCEAEVAVTVTDMYFDERTYGDITMPEGEYTALRVEIGKAEGRNWWCVMYPPLCLPAACSEEIETDGECAEELFDEKQRDIIYNPQKYRVRFALWDKIKSLADEWFVKSDENAEAY